MTDTVKIKALVDMKTDLRRELKRLAVGGLDTVEVSAEQYLKFIETALIAIEALKPLASGEMVMVPREPTSEMLSAGRGKKSPVEAPEWVNSHGYGPSYLIYRAMLAATEKEPT